MKQKHSFLLGVLFFLCGFSSCIPQSFCNASFYDETYDPNWGVKPQFTELDVFSLALLNSLATTGIDNTIFINKDEGLFLNYIFGIKVFDYSFAGKKVHFRNGKRSFFEWIKENHRLPGGCYLYFFDETQKTEIGGYDAVITEWSHFALPKKDIRNSLKKQSPETGVYPHEPRQARSSR